MRAHGWAAALGLWGSLTAFGEGRAAAAPAPIDPFAACRQQLAADPENYESSYCFFITAQRERLFDQVVPVFEALIRQQPGNYWLPLSLGHVYRQIAPDRTEAFYRQAAD